MTKFSDRIGVTQPLPIQLNSVSDGLRTAIWNVLITTVEKSDWTMGLKAIYSYLDYPIDSVYEYHAAINRYKSWILSTSKWFELLNFIEDYPNIVSGKFFCYSGDIDNYLSNINTAFEKHNLGYRFISNQLVPITSEYEIKSIEEAVNTPHAKLNGVRIHMNTALEHLSKKPNPDYRNSMKESISAVESLAKVLTGNQSATLTQALKTLDKTMPMHTSLKKSLEALYGYTCDGDGIRHGLTDESNLGLEDAVFMLVICSAFINYMTQKASKLEIL